MEIVSALTEDAERCLIPTPVVEALTSSRPLTTRSHALRSTHVAVAVTVRLENRALPLLLASTPVATPPKISDVVAVIRPPNVRVSPCDPCDRMVSAPLTLKVL